MKKALSLGLLFFLFVNLCAGCASPPNAAGSTEESADAADAVSDDELESYEPYRFFAGGFSFQTDPANRVELAASAGADGDQTVSLQTADGITWTLTIPPGALSDDVVISMTELHDVVSEDLGAISSGVMLEPDGLTFYQPVTLTISGEGLGQDTFMFGGSHDGSVLGLVEHVRDGGQVTAWLSHFSSALADLHLTREAREALQHALDQGYPTLKQRARLVSNKPFRLLDHDEEGQYGRCTDPKEDRQARDRRSEYFEEYMNPEWEILQDLFMVRSYYSDLNWNSDINETMQKLATRIRLKVERFQHVYAPSPYHYEQFEYLVRRTEVQFGNMGLSLAAGDPDNLQYLGLWSAKLAEQYLFEYRDKHDYELRSAAVSLARFASSWPFMRATWIDDYVKADVFTVEYTLQILVDVDEDKPYTTTTHGTALHNRMDDNYDWFRNREYYARGTASYTGFDSPWPEARFDRPNTYTFEAALVDIDPCRQTILIAIDRFGAQIETLWAAGEDGFIVNWTDGFQQACMLANYEQEAVTNLLSREGTLFFQIAVPLQNLNVTAGELTETRTTDDVTTILNLKLIHTPQK